MSKAALKYSQIEFMRKRTHGAQRLKLYRVADDNENLTLLQTLTKGFLITRNPDTQEGAPEHLMTIDMVYSPNLTAAILKKAFMVDLVEPTTNERQRYRLTTNTQPLLTHWRYVHGLHPAYNDDKAVVI